MQSHGEGGVLFRKGGKEGLSKKLTFRQGLDCKEGGRHTVYYLGEELSMKRDSKARGTEAEASFACSGNSKDSV